MNLEQVLAHPYFLWAVFGLVIGMVAKYLVPGKDKGGLITTILLGIGGSFLGAYLGKYFGIHAQALSSGVTLLSALTALAGSIVLLILFRVFKLIW